MAKTKQTLANLRRALKAADRALLRARNELRAAVKRGALSTEGIFSETKFVMRTTAHRWAQDAKDQAETEKFEIFEILRKMAKGDLAPSPFAHLAAPQRTPEEAGKPRLVINNTTSAEVVDENVAPEAPSLAAAEATPAIISPESKRIL